MAEFILSAFADEGGETASEQIAVLRENGITHIEPRGVNGVNISDFTADMAKELKKQLDGGGIGVSAIGSPFGKIGIHEDFKPHFEKFKQCVENACILGTKNIRIFSFFIDKNEKYEDCRSECFERLDTMSSYALKNGVMCCHENEKGIWGDTDDRCLDILKSFKGKIRGVFDPANFIQCGVQVLPAFEKLSGFTEYLHIKDALFSDGAVVPPGKGDGNIKELLKRCGEEKDGSVFLTLEPHLISFVGLEKLEQKGGIADKLKNVYTYKTNKEAFSAAAGALKEILKEIQ